MNIFSIDLETTGTNAQAGHKILEIGIVYFDDQQWPDFDDIDPDTEERRYFHRYVYPGKEFNGSLFALNLNKKQIEILSHYEETKLNKFVFDDEIVEVCTYEELAAQVEYFVRVQCQHKYSIPVLGKNFASFDAKFLDYVPNWMEKLHHMHRIADVAPLYKERDDKKLPSLEECMKRCEPYANRAKVPHTALEDAEITANLWIWALGTKEIMKSNSTILQRLMELHRGYVSKTITSSEFVTAFENTIFNP